MNTSALHKAARAYSEAGWGIFPCVPGEKRPACPKGHYEATDKIEQIDAWWGANPDFNIGFDPHTIGWCAVDRDEGGVPPEMPETFTVATPNHGEHFYFEGELPQTKDALGRHIDTRGDGKGYLLLPPSIVGGKRYRVTKEMFPPAPLPQWIADKARAPKTSKTPKTPNSSVEWDQPNSIDSAITTLKAQPLVKEEHGGDIGTLTTAHTVRGLKISEAKCVELMLEHYKCEPRDERFEAFIRRKVANAYKYPQDPPGVHASLPGSKLFNGHASLGRTTTNGAALMEAPTSFLWYPYIPAGSISLLCGRGAVGKGLVASSLAAAVTTGDYWPGSSERAAKGTVLWCEAEDDPRRTLKPRWLAAGAECERIELVQPKTFPALQLRSFIAENDVRLVIMSPAVSFLENLHDINAELGVRAALQLVQDAIEDTNTAVLMINHINKKTEVEGIDRVLGSVAWTNFVRSVMFCAQDEEDETKKRFAHAKHNLSKRGDDLLFETKSVDSNVRGQRVRVEWSKPDANTDTATQFERKKKRAEPATDAAVMWLQKFLGDGPSHSTAVWDEGHMAGHSEHALKSAIKRLKIKPKKDGLNGGWQMALPS